MNSLAITSLLISVGGVGLTSYLTWRSWRRFRCAPSDERTWRLVASMALLTAFITLLVTATGVIVRDDVSHGTFLTIQHLAMVLRGALLAQALALAYGWRKSSDFNIAS